MHLPILTLSLAVNAVIAFPGMGRDSTKSIKDVREIKQVAKVEVPSTTTTRASYKPYLGPRKGDVRSPCPGLNSAANHDICPRSGKGYTIPILIACLKEAYNMGADFTTAIGAAGIGSNPNPLALQFDLDQLDRHEIVIEHDGSLSRGDAFFGNNYSFNQTIFDTVLDYFKGSYMATIPLAAKARYNRIKTEAARDPSFFYGPFQFILSYGETALYLSAMGNPITGNAPVDYVKSFFENETLPYHLGWTPPVIPTTLASLAQMVLQLNAANGEPLPEGLIVTESTVKQVLMGIDPVTGKTEYPAQAAVSKLLGLTS